MGRSILIDGSDHRGRRLVRLNFVRGKNKFLGSVADEGMKASMNKCVWLDERELLSLAARVGLRGKWKGKELRLLVGCIRTRVTTGRVKRNVGVTKWKKEEKDMMRHVRR